MPNSIRIGDSETLVYTRYNPLPVNPLFPNAKRAPNYASPVNLTGLTAKFVIVQNAVSTVFQGTKVVIEPLLGRTTVKLIPSDTTALIANLETESYLEFTNTSTGVVESIIQRQETVKHKWQT